jgi:hypothetical protein
MNRNWSNFSAKPGTSVARPGLKLPDVTRIGHDILKMPFDIGVEVPLGSRTWVPSAEDIALGLANTRGMLPGVGKAMMYDNMGDTAGVSTAIPFSVGNRVAVDTSSEEVYPEGTLLVRRTWKEGAHDDGKLRTELCSLPALNASLRTSQWPGYRWNMYGTTTLDFDADPKSQDEAVPVLAGVVDALHLTPMPNPGFAKKDLLVDYTVVVEGECNTHNLFVGTHALPGQLGSTLWLVALCVGVTEDVPTYIRDFAAWASLQAKRKKKNPLPEAGFERTTVVPDVGNLNKFHWKPVYVLFVYAGAEASPHHLCHGTTHTEGISYKWKGRCQRVGAYRHFSSNPTFLHETSRRHQRSAVEVLSGQVNTAMCKQISLDRIQRVAIVIRSRGEWE